MKKILICDKILDAGLKLLEDAQDITLIKSPQPEGPELYKLLSDVKVAITRSSTAVNKAFLDAAPKLSAVVRAGVGVDNVDMNECSRRGVIVMNVPAANTIAAVELSFAHMLAAARSFPLAHNSLKLDRKWQRSQFYGVELKDKALGIIGFGNIGRRLATRAQAFDMRIYAYDPYASPELAAEMGAIYCSSLDDMLPHIDFLSIHTPKTPETKAVISAKEISMMKKGVRLINCARGGLYDEKALCDGLRSGHIAWLGIDCFENEPDTTSPLLDFPNVSVTPHLGASTIESQEAIAKLACEQALAAAREISYPNALNLPVKTEELPPFARPYIDLISRMAHLAYELEKTQIKKIKLKACGAIAPYAKTLLSFATVSALKPIMGDHINYVNAPFVLEDKGIKAILESEERHCDYANSLELKVITDTESSSIKGTVFGEKELRIVEINGFETDFAPKGKVIISRNKDVPGVIAKLTKVLASHDINIADFRLGRNGYGQAMAITIIDEAISPAIKQELKDLGIFSYLEYLEI